MPPLEYASMEQKAVLWARTGTSDFGRPAVASPVEIDCDWEDVIGTTPNQFGEPSGDSATVRTYTELTLGSELWLGLLQDFNALGSAPDTADVMVVVQVYRTPDIKAREILHSAKLMKKGASHG